MSKSSTVTVREKPVEDVASATVGGLTIHGETIVVETDQRIELVDLTNRVMEFARRFNIREGLISLWSMHTTCALFINEFQTALLSDIKGFLERADRQLDPELGCRAGNGDRAEAGHRHFDAAGAGRRHPEVPAVVGEQVDRPVVRPRRIGEDADMGARNR